jgi:hypothetical protein
MAIRKLMMAAAIAATAMTGTPGAALAHDRGHGHGHGHYRHYDDYRGDYGYREYYRPSRPVYYESYAPRRTYYRDAPRRSCRTSGTTGLIIGGAAGALLGRELDGGRDRATGTILGAGTGALVGRELSRKSRC